MSSTTERKLAAIVFTDIVGFTKIMTDSEDKAFSILSYQDEIINPLLDQFNGNLLKKMGDGLLLEFGSTVNAVECSIKIQSAIKEHNKNNSVNSFKIRIGIHLGDIIKMGDDILGDGVNIASRIEPLAEPGGICITDAVQNSIKSKLKIDSKRIYEVKLKHLVNRYTIYKFPVDIEENQQPIKQINIDKNKIKINYIEKKSNLIHRFISGFKEVGWRLGLYGAISLVLIQIVVLYYFLGNYMGVERFLDPKFIDFNFTIRRFIVNFLLFSSFPSYIHGFVKYNISFDDLRLVIPTLDLIITRGWAHGKWNLQLNENNKIIYTGFPSNFQKNMSLPFQKLTYSITCIIDGNTIQISGSGSKLKSSINALKKIAILK